MFHTITRMRLDFLMRYGLTLELSPYALRNETARLVRDGLLRTRSSSLPDTTSCDGRCQAFKIQRPLLPDQPFARPGADQSRARSSSYLADGRSLRASAGSRRLVSFGSTRISARRRGTSSIVD
jgi:hypothetical protein